MLDAEVDADAASAGHDDDEDYEARDVTAAVVTAVALTTMTARLIADWSADWRSESPESISMFRGRPAIECPGSYRPGLFLERPITIQVSTNKVACYGVGCRDLIYVHDSRGAWRFNLEALMLTPKTIREVERCLLLCLKARAVVVSPSVAAGRISEGRLGLHFWFNFYSAMCLLARLVKVGSPGKAAVAQVLNMLGGPMERMDWADGAGQWDKVNRRYRYFGTTSRPSSSSA